MSSGYSSALNLSVASSDVELNFAEIDGDGDVDEDDDDEQARRKNKAGPSKKKTKSRKYGKKKKSAQIVAIAEEEEDVDEDIATAGNDEKRMCGLSDLVTACLSSTSSSSSSSSSSAESSLKQKHRKHVDEDDIDDDMEKNILCNGKGKSTYTSNPFLRASQFTGVPPTIRFYTKGTKVTKPARKIVNRLTWCHNSLLPIVMRHTLAASHFTVVDESLFYVGYWGRHLKSAQYKSLQPHQKVNHFPGAFHIGRKDRLWMHIQKQQERFGDEFNIMPFTYILPQEKDELMEYLEQDESRHVIIKPPASARGTGIQVTRKQRDFSGGVPLVAQHYVDRPLTINKAKFDLRLYAYVPSLEPLRVYIYDQGLVRFASVPYSSAVSSISNKYMHLTNYSINKLAEQDGVANKPVPKWTLTHLWEWLEARGVASRVVKQQIEDVIIKAFISCERPIREHMAKYLQQEFICYELFGIDILLDEELKPWLLEVNISPSLHSGTPLDVAVKSPLAKDVLNIAGVYVPPNLDELAEADYSTRPRNGSKSREQLIKEVSWVAAYQEQLGEMDKRILKRLTPEDTRMLVEVEDELKRAGDFRLVFPTAHTTHYQRYFSEPLYANLMLQQWQIEQEEDRDVGVRRIEQLCRQGHLQSDQS